MKNFSRRLAVLAPLFVLAACGTPKAVTYKGQAVSTINPVTMTCASPYALTQGCASGSLATMRTMAVDLPVRVSGNADGRTVLVTVDTTTNPSDANQEFAADAVQRFAGMRGARLVKIEALQVVGSVGGYVLHFDRDVYTELVRAALPR